MVITLRQNLHLESNRFTSAIPSELGRITALSASLHMQSNSLSGSIPSQVRPAYAPQLQLLATEHARKPPYS